MEWLTPVLAWVAAHAHWAGPLIGLVAFAESLALVGLFVPGALAMFAAGALVGTGHLPFWPLYAWSVVGAIAGDGLSFWIGRYYGGALRRRWPFSRHPDLLERGVRFFAAHGGKGVLLGRFVGPVRPIIPAVAGMLDMPGGRFLLVNVASALAWAPAYLLPGMVFGASLAVAASVATRLVTLVVAALILAWLAWRLPGWLRPVFRRTAVRLLHRRPGARPLRGLRHPAGMLWLVALVTLLVTQGVALRYPLPAGWEQDVLDVLDAHRSALLRILLWLVTQLGSTLAVAIAAAAVTATLAIARRGRAAAVYAGSVAGTVALGYVLKALYAAPRPGALTGEAFGFAFPSGHSYGIAVFVVATAVLVAPPAWRGRRWLFAAAGIFAVTVSLTRLGLGVHWPRDLVAGLALGVVGGGLPALLGPGRCPPGLRRRVLTVAVPALTVGALVNGLLSYPDGLARYPAVQDRTPVTASALCSTPGLESPGTRIWQGRVAALDEALKAAGWRAMPAWTLQATLRWLSPDPSPALLPVLPRVEAGRWPAAVWIDVDGPDRRVLWLWWRAAGVDAPVWLVAAADERLRPGWPFVLRTLTPAAVPVAELRTAGRLCPAAPGR
ncbi:VTT domain-containing protein [Arhodomonas sp. KWT2]|uniref:VTT domain-containing protein n=1 Tax=unclassified Arhodomonas TaxID=2621637 RepID=UPI0013D4799D|nr:VTT domain-containing protein [Arhodomonas sp. KWT]